MSGGGFDHSPKGGLRMAPEDYSDFASDDPEHARRQCGDLKYDVTEIYDHEIRRVTGPDTRQPEMVSKSAVLRILNDWIDASHQSTGAAGGAVRDALLHIKDRVRKL